MPVSIKGNSRTEYTQYVDCFRKTLLYSKSDEVDFSAHPQWQSKYSISLLNSIKCDSNQILTCALHSADIPITTYQINDSNNTFYIYLKDWEHKNFGLTDNGVIPVVLTSRNYTTAQLIVKIQETLDDLVDVEFANEFNIAVGVGETGTRDNSYTDVPTTEFPTLAFGTDATIMAGMFQNFDIELSGGIPISDPNPNTYKYNPVNLEYTVNDVPTQANLGVYVKPDGTVGEVLIKSQPRFYVSLEETSRIQIQRIDLIGAIPSKNLFLKSRFYISANKLNNFHLGLGKPTWVGLSPTSEDMEVNIYNLTGRKDSSREFGSIVQSQYQTREFGLIGTFISPHYKNRIYFPHLPNLNIHSSILIKSNRLKANVSNSGKQSNIIAKVPINVQQGFIVNYEPATLVRYNLGNGSEIQYIDIQLTDTDGTLLDFNGCPHSLSFLFEVWNVVSIPLHKGDGDVSYKDPKAQTLTDGHFSQRYNSFY
jgi:hypothetical protein